MTRVLSVMPREMRMMSERILSLTGLPKGFCPALCDVVMYSEAAGLGGFARLERDLEVLKRSDPARMRTGEGGLDAAGCHPWVVLPSALDLLGEGAESLEICNVAAPEELAVAGGLAPRHGLMVTVEGTRLTAKVAPEGDPVLEGLMRSGCRIPEDLWWRIWALAQTALLPDSDVSRRHAGPVIVNPDGTLTGRTDNDDDSDPNFLRAPEKGATA